MDINPIPYSAFIKEDNSIQNLINQLSTLQDKYVELLNVIKTDAVTAKKSLTEVNAATAEGQSTVNASALGVQRLKKLQDELKLALSETGLEIAKYKDLLASATKENNLNAKTILSNNQSLKQLKSELTLLVKQYEELSAEERLNGESTTELTNRILFLRQEIKNATNNITLQTKATKDQSQINKALEAAVQKLVNAYSNETNELLRIKRETDEVLKIKRLEARIADGTTDSYNRLAAEYELNMINLNKYSQAVINSSRFLTRQQEESKKMRLEMIRLKEATGNHALSVGNYTKAWNGLGMATQQVVRELPAMAVSMQTFFIAISNNLPILADEIKNLIQQNKLAAEAGRATTSVWRTLIRSFISWQTALVLGLTVLSLYGGKLIELAKNLFTAKGNVESLDKAVANVNKTFSDANKSYGDTIIQFRVLQEQWKLLGDDLEKRTKFIEDNAQAFNSLGVSIESVNDAENIFVNNSEAFLRALELRAKGEAARELAAEMYKKDLELRIKEETKLEKQRFEQEQLFARAEQGMYTMQETEQVNRLKRLQEYSDSLASTLTEEQKRGLEELGESTFKKQGDQYIKIFSDTTKEISAIFEELGIKPIDISGKKTTEDDSTKNLLEIERANIEIRKRYAQSVTDLERDELEKQKKQLIDTYNAEVDDLRNKQKNDEKLTQESRDLINEIIINSTTKLNTDLQLLEIDFQQRQLNLEKEGLDLRLALAEQGTEEYYRIRNALLRNQMDYEILENRKLIESQQKDEQAIRDKYNYDILQNEIALDDLFFKQAQEYAQSEFDLVKHSEYEKNKFRLQQEKDFWVRRLEMAKAGLLPLSNLEIKTAENMIGIINRQLSELDLGRDLFDLAGIELDNEQKAAVAEATTFIKDQINSIIDAELRLAEIKVEKAKEQVNTAYELLQAEMEARNEGYAHNVETANRELKLAEERERKALEQQRQIQLARERLNTIEQVSSLITASANIWKSFSTLGPFGIPAAVAAITLMFGSFVAAKVKAQQVVNTEVEQYAEGHVELLEGGSHTSGNDIPLGKTKKGKTRKAEGGEVLAVVNKRSVSKYGTNKVFDVINSLNKGIFEDKYLKIFSPINYQINSGSNTVDLLDIDTNVKAIREQNEYKYFSDSKGLFVEQYKNRTRIFKR